MASRSSRRTHRPRELRRRVVVPARLRDGLSWSDTCILNVSSHGLLIQTNRPLAKDCRVELRRGDRVIVARVVWREGALTGLQADQRVPLDDILTIGQSPRLQLTAACGERRTQPRLEDRSRLRGRALEFAGVLAIAVSLAGAAGAIVHKSFAGSLALVAVALGG